MSKVNKYYGMVVIANEAMGLSYPRGLGKVTKTESGFWLDFFGRPAYLGESEEAAFRTAKRGDWWVPDRDGPLTESQKKHFSLRRGHVLNEGSEWATIYYKNVEESQTFRTLSATRKFTPSSEMDEGEQATEEDWKAVWNAKKDPSVETVVIPIYKLFHRREQWWWQKLLFTDHKDYLSYYYAWEQSTERWRKVHISARPDGWKLQLGDALGERKSTVHSTERGELICEAETGNLLNFKLYDMKGDVLLRLVGDGHGGVKFYELNIDPLE